MIWATRRQRKAARLLLECADEIDRVVDKLTVRDVEKISYLSDLTNAEAMGLVATLIVLGNRFPAEHLIWRLMGE